MAQITITKKEIIESAKRELNAQQVNLEQVAKAYLAKRVRFAKNYMTYKDDEVAVARVKNAEAEFTTLMQEVKELEEEFEWLQKEYKHTKAIKIDISQVGTLPRAIRNQLQAQLHVPVQLKLQIV